MTSPGRLLLILPLLGLLVGSLQGCGGAPRSPVTRDTGGISAIIAATSSTTSTIASVKDIRMWHAPERSRIVFDMDRQAAFNVIKLKNPERLAIDLSNARIKSAIPGQGTTGQFIEGIRSGQPKKNTTRLVFDLTQQVRYAIRMLRPSGGYQYRLVVDFYDRNAAVESDKVVPPRKPGSELLIVVDPGHGGEDPGALGKRTYEKQVVLQIAKKLKAKIDKQPGLRAELTRTGDYYIPLRKRTRIARQHRADLFVSIHADAFKNKSARGASVYALSRGGASSEAAKWLANKENSADLAGGLNLGDKDDALAGTFLDMSITNTVNESIDFGRDVLTQLKKVGRVHSKRVEQAGFVVLKSPDIPSILVETAYITNPTEEKLLRSSQHQNKIADAIVAGIKHYISKNASRYANY